MAAGIPTRGYFGKVPASMDFVFHGLPMRVSERWADVMAEWLARGARTHASRWSHHVLTSPVWRFALGRDIVGGESWLGLMAGSIDGTGRLFPFTAMLAADIDLAARQPFDAFDRLLDQVEPTFLEFMDGTTASANLVASLDAVTATISSLTQTATHALLLPEPNNQALAILGDGHTAVAVPAKAADATSPSRYMAWWQAGTTAMAATRLISRGMLPARNAVALFDADWERHGWERR